MQSATTPEDNILNPRKVEIIDDIVYMSPLPNFKHNKIMFRITSPFEAYLKGKKCSVHMVGNVYIDKDNPKTLVIPDISILCEPDKFKLAGYYGVPSLIVEILSTNRKDDLGTKFEFYERMGVSEYWIVDPLNDSINQYILVNGRYKLLDAYRHLLQEEFETLDEKEQEEYKTSIVPNIFSDLDIPLKDVFED
ncbi:MAG: hypothetical protein ATN36_07045 [Epulopiscium sp. Nele67-Bin005]|nr:MAG: hypothetical protein ATN36_07045 [Epulopiscium sp. Nele67-Bin005]